MVENEDLARCECPDYLKESVLSFDGGGVRTLSTLLILRKLLETIRDVKLEFLERQGLAHNKQDDDIPLACQYFSFMFGSGTGGILATMLGRLRMPIDDCIETFRLTFREVFAKKRIFHSFGRDKYDTERLEELIRQVIRERSGDPDTSFYDRDVLNQGEATPMERSLGRFTSCRVGVLATEQSDSNGADYKAHLFRSYYNPTPPLTLALGNRPGSLLLNLTNQQGGKIWQISRATSAAPSYFKHIKVWGLTYIDGGLTSNNLVEYAMAEVDSLHQHHPSGPCPSGASKDGLYVLVSIGSGRETDSESAPIRRLRQTLSERGHNLGAAHDRPSKTPHEGNSLYYRFDVKDGLGAIGLDELGSMEGETTSFTSIKAATLLYLENFDTRNRLRVLAKKLVDHYHHRQQALRRLINEPELAGATHTESPVSRNHATELPSVAETASPQDMNIPNLSATSRSPYMSGETENSRTSSELDVSALSSAWDTQHPAPSTLPTEDHETMPQDTSSGDKHHTNVMPLDDIDCRSIASVDCDIHSVAETSTFANVRELAAYEVTKAFMGVQVTSDLYERSAKHMEDEFFLRNHQRLLKLFYLGALLDADTESEKLVVRFFRSRKARRRISDRIVSMSSYADSVDIDTVENRDHLLRHLEPLIAQANVSDTTSAWANDIADEDNDDFEQSASDDENFDFENNEDGSSGLLPDAVSPLITAAMFLTNGQAFRVYQNNLSRFVSGVPLAPESFKVALEVRDVDQAIRLLAEETSAVTQTGLEFEWIAEALEIGLSPSDVVHLILEQNSRKPWIFYDPPELGDFSINSTFHRTTCVHNGFAPPNSEDHDHDCVSQCDLRTDGLQGLTRVAVSQTVTEMCGLAGVVPYLAPGIPWNGNVSFQDTSATVTYVASETIQVAHSPDGNEDIIQRTLGALRRVTTLIAWLQYHDLVCDHFVILRRTIDASAVESVTVPFGQVIELQANLDLQATFKDAIGPSTTGSILNLLEAFCGKVDLAEAPDGPDLSNAIVDAFALVVQALCVGMLTFSHACTGELRPFFLDHSLSRVSLNGADGYFSRKLMLSLRPENLTCIGDMINAPVMVFCCGDSIFSVKRHLNTSLASLFELWGPGHMVVDRSQPTERNICGAELGGGVIYQSSEDSALFHWSREAQLNQDTLAHGSRISSKEIITIGALFKVNPICPFSDEFAQKPVAEQTLSTLNTMCRIHSLGTFGESWKLREVQSGIQAGQYAMVAVNLTWVKSDSRTLKIEILSAPLNLSTPEAPWGVLVSMCTGVALRVPLREVVAEVVVPMVNSWAEKPDQWQSLLETEDGIVAELRRPTFRQWFKRLTIKKRKAVVKVVEHVLRKICWTGINQAEELVVASPTSQDDGGCVRIPCRDNQAWAKILKDSQACATFACLTTRCIETGQQRCRNSANPEWLNKTSHLATAVCQYQWQKTEERKLAQQQFEQDKPYYWMAYAGDECRFIARAIKGSPAHLSLSESKVPKMLRLSMERMARLKTPFIKLEEKRLVDEALAKDVLLRHCN